MKQSFIFLLFFVALLANAEEYYNPAQREKFIKAYIVSVEAALIYLDGKENPKLTEDDLVAKLNELSYRDFFQENRLNRHLGLGYEGLIEDIGLDRYLDITPGIIGFASMMPQRALQVLFDSDSPSYPGLSYQRHHYKPTTREKIHAMRRCYDNWTLGPQFLIRECYKPLMKLVEREWKDNPLVSQGLNALKNFTERQKLLFLKALLEHALEHRINDNDLIESFLQAASRPSQASTPSESAPCKVIFLRDPTKPEK